MQHQLVYDGSFDGFLTAVFMVYEERLEVVSLTPEAYFQAGFFAEGITVITDSVKANRVWKGLSKYAKFRSDVYWSFLSEIEGNELVLLKAIQYVLATSRVADYGHPQILRTAQVRKMVGREKHRMEAFIRFQLTKDAIYFAHVEPDFNVLPLIATHFKNRYADQAWIIYDLKRSYGLYYDLHDVVPMQMDFNEKNFKKIDFTENEPDYSALWRNYFKSTTIKSRINLKLHTQHVPKRYWKYLNEKAPD
ncbi:TIGR03915 family putative DNA repair protein [Flavimarina sp. Hel_I_48]|uniref:TIGR03915 family putative DNA repair protein n=1 Tax=Flavimarina sp. Hel_I_48 TaxID=1392488 RepID=UPI0004DFB991|nr:TIGR03915 family putative DNA repair protein [Flavimarina sp. Hel_I_48]